MAKVTKKVSKKLKTEPKIAKEITAIPPIEPGMVSLALSESDLLAFASLMSVCAQTFEKLAVTAAAENDQNSFRIFQNRCQLSSAFANKLAEYVHMPEPVSRENH